MNQVSYDTKGISIEYAMSDPIFGELEGVCDMPVFMRGNYIFVEPGRKCFEVSSNFTNYLELGIWSCIIFG